MREGLSVLCVCVCVCVRACVRACVWLKMQPCVREHRLALAHITTEQNTLCV